MTNKEYYGDRLEVVYDGNVAAIYYYPAHTKGMNLIACLFKDECETILERVELWLNEPATTTPLYYYEDLEGTN